MGVGVVIGFRAVISRGLGVCRLAGGRARRVYAEAEEFGAVRRVVRIDFGLEILKFFYLKPEDETLCDLFHNHFPSYPSMRP